jgi:hypothetical protein
VANVPPTVAAAAVPAAFGYADGAAVVTDPAVLGSSGKAATAAEPAGAEPAAVGCAGGAAAAFCGLARLAGIGLLVLQLTAAESHTQRKVPVRGPTACNSQQISMPMSLFLTIFQCYVTSVDCLLAECAQHAGLPRQLSRNLSLTCIPLCAAWSCCGARADCQGLRLLCAALQSCRHTHLHESVYLVCCADHQDVTLCHCDMKEAVDKQY